MCYKIESSFIMIHHLKNRENCTIKELVRKKNIIERNIPSVFVDISRNSVMSSIASYPEIFHWEKNSIFKKENSNDFYCEPLIDFFDFNIDKSIKMAVTKVLEVE